MSSRQSSRVFIIIPKNGTFQDLFDKNFAQSKFILRFLLRAIKRNFRTIFAFCNKFRGYTLKCDAGVPGLSAYIGLTEVGKAKPGETLGTASGGPRASQKSQNLKRSIQKWVGVSTN